MLSNLENELDLLQRHVQILKLVMRNEPIGIIKLSEQCGMPQHKVRYSLRILEQRGIIRPSPQGAISTEKAREFLKTFPGELKALEKKIVEIYNSI